jgi:hypothetical protein
VFEALMPARTAHFAGASMLSPHVLRSVRRRASLDAPLSRWPAQAVRSSRLNHARPERRFGFCLAGAAHKPVDPVVLKPANAVR